MVSKSCVAIARDHLVSLGNGVCELLEDQLGVVPVYACIGDTDAVLEASLALFWHLLRTYCMSVIALYHLLCEPTYLR